MLSSTEKNQLRRINRMLRSEYEVIRHPREGSRTER